MLILNGAGEENRTPVSSLEGYYSTIKLHLQVIKIIAQFFKKTIKSLKMHKIMVTFKCIHIRRHIWQNANGAIEKMPIE